MPSAKATNGVESMRGGRGESVTFDPHSPEKGSVPRF